MPNLYAIPTLTEGSEPAIRWYMGAYNGQAQRAPAIPTLEAPPAPTTGCSCAFVSTLLVFFGLSTLLGWLV